MRSRLPEFIPGKRLSLLFFEKVVRPLLSDKFGGLSYSAALIGAGSEVMGFDTPMSRDHNWGPRLQIFLADNDLPELAASISNLFDSQLPKEFLGYPTAYTTTVDADQPPRHRIELTTIRSFIEATLAIDIDAELAPADWLTFPEQHLRSIVDGAVFHDDLGLIELQRRFSYYPHDVWLYLLASGWERIAQEEHLVGRAGYVGDELGASIIASRLVRDLMRLCFLMERRYAPYPKWFGTAFDQLNCAAELKPMLLQTQRARGWRRRDAALASAYEYVARKQNELGLSASRLSAVQPFHDRPFSSIALSSGFAEALRAEINDPVVREIASRRNIGSIDQFSDSTDLLSCERSRRKLRTLFE